MEEINERLDRIESLLQRLPEIQAAVFISMWEEWQENNIFGTKAKDLWEVPNPKER